MYKLESHEKFWAFMMLIVGIVALSITAALVEAGEGFRILDAAVVGLIGIAGAAGQSLFKFSRAENLQAAALENLSEKTPPVTGEARQVMQEGDGSWMQSNSDY